MPTQKPFLLYLVSDGTCRTCEHVVRAVLMQFAKVPVRLVRKPNVHEPATVEKLVQSAADARAVVFYTLVEPATRAAIQAAARQHMVPVVDLLGPVLGCLYDLFKTEPAAKPGILYETNKAHFDRIDAVEYTLMHDDGCRTRELADADVVLVGVSRTAKSTTCFYLAYSGIRAANVPLVAETPPPPELTRLDPRRVIGLTTNPYRLQSVREARLRGWNMDINDQYANDKQIARELRAADELMKKHGWRVIDTSYKAIEEIAREVRQLLADSGIPAGNRGEVGEAGEG